MKLKIALAIAAITACVSCAWVQLANTLGGGFGLSESGSNQKKHYVSPYVNSHGIFVQGRWHSNHNSTQLDDQGTRGSTTMDTRLARF